MPSIDGTPVRGTASPRSVGGGTAGHDQRSAFSKEHGQAQPLLGLANMNRSQLADKARQPARGSFADVAHILAGSLVLDSFSPQAAFSCQAGVRGFK